MISVDLWQEIYQTVRRNRLRTFLTALSVAWGIFMLVVLLAFGRGLRNNVVYEFRDDAVNGVWVRPGQTSKPWQGHKPGRFLQFTDEDVEAVARLPGVEHITARYFPRGGDTIVARGPKTTSFEVRGVHPDHRFLEKTEMIRGRYLDDLDVTQRRKVAVIGDAVRDFLFAPGEDPIGRSISVAGLPYQVIGVFSDAGGEGERKKVFLPITTAQMAYGGLGKVDMFMFSVGQATLDQSQALERRALGLLAERHHFDPDDKRALRLRNNLVEFEKITKVIRMIELFVWAVGLGTILAGIVGVSNIMMIAVKERTREIGVRKALGATPTSILGMITVEALVLTAVAGYLGLVAGVGAIEAVRRWLPLDDVIRDPEVDLGIALSATLLLIVCGTLAGFFPAWRAARVNPIEALRDE